MIYPRYVDEIIRRLADFGEQTYLVGGSLRDILMGLEPHDYDLTTSASPHKTLEVFSDKRVIETGLKHGTVTVLWDGEPVEITTFRVDGDYTDARHPDSVSFTRDIREDLSRRDFTVNAIAYNPQSGIVDPFGGEADIRARLLRAVGEPERRFTEDALRIMRAFRFCAQLGFDIHADTLAGIDATKHRLALIARERIGSEFWRLIASADAPRALSLMSAHGVFPYVLGDHAPTSETIGAIACLPRVPELRLSLLLHGLDQTSVRKVLRELRLSGKQITAVTSILRGVEYTVTDAHSARRLIAATGIYAADAAMLSELLGISPQGAYELTIKQENTPCSVKDLKINGKVLSELGIRGKAIGQTLDMLFDMVIADPELNNENDLLKIVKEKL